MSEPRIVIVGFPSAQILDITGPLEVFSTASRFLPIPRYATQLVSTDGGPVLSTSGLEFATEPDRTGGRRHRHPRGLRRQRHG